MVISDCYSSLLQIVFLFCIRVFSCYIQELHAGSHSNSPMSGISDAAGGVLSARSNSSTKKATNTFIPANVETDVHKYSSGRTLFENLLARNNHAIGNDSAPIQLAHCRFAGQAISRAKILIYFSNKMHGSNFVKQQSETVTL